MSAQANMFAARPCLCGPLGTGIVTCEGDMELPKFRYHPDPVATGSIREGAEACECCGKATGYVYTSSIYAEQEVQFVCPWCIADGSAARKFDAIFSDDYPLIDAGVPDDIVEEVTQRTPGYDSWQQGEWQAHCNDACEFHGDATKAELEALEGDALSGFLDGQMIKPEVWRDILANYQPGGSPAVYRFACRHCGKVVYTMDFA
jgi:uncharacterized protein CbrC (UPF0167 family)